MQNMFNECSSLNTIYVSDLWNSSAVTDSTTMFHDSKSLIGSSDTAYNSIHADVSSAKVDGDTESPGYFTYKEFNKN